MSYTAPYISPTAGLVIPSYADTLSDLISNYQAIYPQVVYIGTDTAKYQELSIFALKIYDTNLGSQLAYNARSPITAVGADLDSIVKMNGLARQAASYSTAPVTVTGAVGKVITNGTVTDTQGYIWDLASPITIPSGGSVTVGATCETAGAIQAQAGSINTISGGATAGWVSASNPSAASVGLPTEEDSQLRARQAYSVAMPSITQLGSINAAIAAVSGVTRYAVEENFTEVTDANGCPPHSITAVVEGGTDANVANAIFLKRGDGALTNGTTHVTCTSATETTVIGFSRQTYVPIYATMVIHGLNGYTTAVLASIQSAIVTYLNGLQIGESVTFSSLYSVAQSVMPSLLTPQFSIPSLFTGTAASPSGTSDIAIAYNEVAQGVTANIIVSQA
jgi:uncharacterized phage protein gp47/JayE